MSLFVFTNFDMCMYLISKGEGAVGRVVAILGKGETAQGRKWFQFKMAFKKYAETLSDKCKYEYYVVKAWGDEAERCEKLLEKGWIAKIGGEFMKSSFTTPDGGRELGEIRLVTLLDVRPPGNYVEQNEEKTK